MNQSELCNRLLSRLESEGVLGDLLLIGSWCGQAYRGYFEKSSYRPVIRTRDVDFLVPSPSLLSVDVDLQSVFESLGFNIAFRGRNGYIVFEHPELIVEFLVPEHGRTSDRPRPLPKLHINAQPLRFLDMLAQNTIRVRFEGTDVRVPHPANFAIHKLIISSRRTKIEKRDKDRALAIEILHSLIDIGEAASFTELLATLPTKWRKAARQALADTPRTDVILAALEGRA